ncbi:MAG: radical SAM family heme chaperone HemW [Ruminococcus sp.]|nr:radical SAM family heme chaperone HemW [Ruminococcus sp.]
MTGIYIHVPFCARKCPYCDFYSVPYRADTAESYTQAVCRNIESYAGQGTAADTIYFGGGTPSLLTGGQIGRIIKSVQNSVQLHDSEITLEANPVTLLPRKLAELREAGINRLSVGVQSADDEQLSFLGRLHDFDRAEKAVRDAAAAGFDNISCDLMLGVKGQDIASLERTVGSLLGLPISHLSAYMLQIEEGTPFDCEAVRRDTADDDLMSELYLRLCGMMTAAGWEHYEISSWARDGKRSRHNMKYWKLEPYIGIGAGAHSDHGGLRFSCPKDIAAFIAAETMPKEYDEPPDRAEEYVMLSLRLSDGIDLRKLREFPDGGNFAARTAKLAPALISHGLMRETDKGFALTDEGFLRSNAIIAELIV